MSRTYSALARPSRQPGTRIDRPLPVFSRSRTSSLIFIAMVLVMLLCPGRSRSQTNAAEATARLDSLVALAASRNAQVKAAEQQWRAIREQRSQVTAWEDPTLSYTRWISTPETRVGPQENAFMLSQRIPFPGKLGTKGEMSDEDARAEEARYHAVLRDVVFGVKRAYYDLYGIDQSIRIIDAYISLLKDFSTIAEQRYATGEGIQASALKAQVEISQMLERRLTFGKLRAGAVARLNALLNQPSETPFDTVSWIDTSSAVPPREAVVRQALADRQELHSAASMVRKSELMASLARLDYYPSFTLQATYITIPRLSGNMFADAGKDPFSVTVGINLPIQFGRRSAAVEEASASTEANRAALKNLENNVEAEIADTYSQLETSATTLDLYDKGLLIQAQSSFESALSAYKTGKLEFLGLLDAERMLLQVRLGYVKELTGFRKLVATLERDAGGSLTP